MGKRDIATLDDIAHNLTPSEVAFVHEWIQDEDGARAWLAAGYNATPEAASVSAHKKLREPKIQAYLASIRAEIAESYELDRETVMRETHKLVTFDVRKLFDAQHGNFIGIKDLDDVSAASISGFKFTSIKADGVEIGRTAEIKLSSKIAALDMAHKILGSYKADNEQRASAESEALTHFVKGLQDSNPGIPLRKKRKR
jgi:phage terminase small subunit